MLICEKKYFKHCTFVLSIARRTINCFQMEYLGRPYVVYILLVEFGVHNQLSLVICDRMTFSACSFVENSVQITLTWFQMWFWTFTADVKSKAEKENYLSGGNFAKGTIFLKGITFSALLERLPVFKIGIRAQTYLQSKIDLDSAIVIYLV